MDGYGWSDLKPLFIGKIVVKPLDMVFKIVVKYDQIKAKNRN
jgi:hypothetical protein